MKKNVIPIPYQLILKKLLEESYDNRLETGRARHILSYGMRMNKKNITRIFIEMKDNGWIEFENHKNIIIIIDENNLTCYS